MMPLRAPTLVLNPMHLFAIRSLATIGSATTKAGLMRYRTAVCTVLEAAGLDMANVTPQPTASFSDTEHHALVVWYDVPCDALRLFAPPCRLIDETTENALSLLDGSITTELDTIPIEDVDAVARMMALMSVGGDDADDLHARFIEPHAYRYDDDFTAPSAADLEELWGRLFPYYFGGTSAAPGPVNAWISRAYAFGVAHVERPAAPATKRAASRESGTCVVSKRSR
jgi:hypothetical protein